MISFKATWVHDPHDIFFVWMDSRKWSQPKSHEDSSLASALDPIYRIRKDPDVNSEENSTTNENEGSGVIHDDEVCFKVSKVPATLIAASENCY